MKQSEMSAQEVCLGVLADLAYLSHSPLTLTPACFLLHLCSQCACLTLPQLPQGAVYQPRPCLKSVQHACRQAQAMLQEAMLISCFAIICSPSHVNTHPSACTTHIPEQGTSRSLVIEYTTGPCDSTL